MQSIGLSFFHDIQNLYALLFSFVLVLGGLFFSYKIKLLDKPHKYSDTIGRKPVPTLQGMFLFLGIVCTTFLFFQDVLQYREFRYFILAALPLLCISFFDDVFFSQITIPTRLRFLVQILVSTFLVISTNIGLESFSILGYEIVFGSIGGVAVSVAWFILCINAINRFDGIHGQASGVSAIGFATICLLLFYIVIPSYSDISPMHLEKLLFVKDISIVFFLYSFLYAFVEWKPRGLVRDPGTFLYGMALAYLSLAGGFKIGTVLVVLSLVIFDAIWVCLHRIFVLKKAPWKGDYSHLHHRLLAAGRTKKEVNVAMLIWSFIMMVLMLMQGSARINKLIIFSMMALLFFGVNAYIFRYKQKSCGLQQPIDPGLKKNENIGV